MADETTKGDVMHQRRLKVNGASRAHLVIVLLLGAVSLVGTAQGQTKSGSYLAIVKWTHIMPNEGGTVTCIIVGIDGQYHMEFTPELPKPSKAKPKLKVSTGFLPDDYFEQFKKLIESKDLIEIGTTPPPPELVWEKETDAVVLSIHRNNGAQDVVGANYDGKHPVLRPVSAFVPWVKEVRNLDDMLVKDPEPNSCRSLEPTGDYLPQLVKR